MIVNKNEKTRIGKSHVSYLTSHIYLKASTLIEALVAMVIILGAFVISCMIYVNVMATDNNNQQLDVQLLLNQIALQTKQENNFISERTETEALIIEKTISKYPDAEDLNKLKIIITNKAGKIIYQYDELIIIH